MCEAPCTQTADCTTPYTVCNGATCTIDLCGLALGGPPNGTLDGTCDASGQNDGTCVPTMAVGDGGAFGVCYQGGPASGQGCSLTATRATPGGLCQAGSICGVSTMGFGTQCYLLCNPTDPNAAAACNVAGFNNGCFQPTARDSQLGVCF